MKKIQTAKGTYVKDITNQRFGRLVAIKLTDKKDKDDRWLWECKCDCGKIVYVPMHKLNSNNTRSCGCLQRDCVIKKNKDNALDLTGQKFGLLTVLYKDEEKSQNGVIYWKCQCDCGTITSVATGELRRGEYGDKSRHGTLSCGCAWHSVGEELVAKGLSKLNIFYEREKYFIGCIDQDTQGKLRFDFYLPEQNCCIEFDGEIHYGVNTGRWNNSINQEKIQKHDKIKNEYCHKNNIHLIRIPYWDRDNIDSIYLEKLINDTI